MKSLIKHVDDVLRVKEYYIVNKALERICYLSDDTEEKIFLRKFANLLFDHINLKYDYEEIGIAAKGLRIQLAYDLICAADKYIDSDISAPEFIVNFLKNRYSKIYGGIYTSDELDKMNKFVQEQILKDKEYLAEMEDESGESCRSICLETQDNDNLDHLFMNPPWEIEDLMKLTLEERMSRFTVQWDSDKDPDPFSSEFDDSKIGSPIYDPEKDFERFFKEHPLLVKTEDLEDRKFDFKDRELYNYVTVYKYNGEYDSYRIPVEPEEKRDKAFDLLENF